MNNPQAISQGINSAKHPGGRPRGPGLRPMDWTRYQDLAFAGLSLEAIAGELHVSRRTLQRRLKSNPSGQHHPGSSVRVPHDYLNKDVTLKTFFKDT